MMSSNIDKVDDDALLHIFSFLTILDKGRVACVCRRWNHLVCNPFLWQRIDLRQLVRKTKSSRPSIQDWYYMFPKDPAIVTSILTKYASGSLKYLRINAIIDDKIQELLRNCCGNLESLECEIDINYGTTLHLPPKLKHLQLVLTSSSKWRPLEMDCNSFVYLQSVSLRNAVISYEVCLCLLLSGNLRVLKLDTCNWQMLTSELQLLLEQLAKLSEFYLIACNFPSPSVIYGLIHHVTNQCLDLKKFEMNQPFLMGYQRDGLTHQLDGILEAIGNCRSDLESFKIAATKGLTLDGLVSVISVMPNLQELSLVSCSDITNDYLQVISTSLKNLKFLDVSRCMHLNDRGLRYLNQHSCLKELRIYGCTCFSHDQLLSTIKSLPEIQSVTLPGRKGYDVCADLIQAFRPKLRINFW